MVRHLVFPVALMAVLGLPSAVLAIEIPKDAKADMEAATTQAALDEAKGSARTACVNAYITDADIKDCKTAVSALWKALKENIVEEWWCCDHWTTHEGRKSHRSCPVDQRCDRSAKGCVPVVIKPCDDVVCDVGENCNPTTGECEPESACGNGEAEGGEACDDGNTCGGDWCSSDCMTSTVPTWVYVDAIQFIFFIAFLIWFFITRKREKGTAENTGVKAGDNVAGESDG